MVKTRKILRATGISLACAVVLLSGTERTRGKKFQETVRVEVLEEGAMRTSGVYPYLASDRRFKKEWLGSESISGFIMVQEKLDVMAGRFSRAFDPNPDTSMRDISSHFVADIFFHQAGNVKIDWWKMLARLEKAEIDFIDRINEFMRLNNQDLAQLPETRDYNSAGKRIQEVRQGEARVVRPNGKSDALYGFLAGNCSLLVLVEKQNGQFRKGLVAHVEVLASEKRIKKTLSAFGGDRGRTEIMLISGNGLSATRLIGIIREYGDIRFVGCDTSGKRMDAVVLTNNGNIYQGELPGWDKRKEEALLRDEKRTGLYPELRKRTGEIFCMPLELWQCE